MIVCSLHGRSCGEKLCGSSAETGGECNSATDLRKLEAMNGGSETNARVWMVQIRLWKVIVGHDVIYNDALESTYR